MGSNNRYKTLNKSWNTTSLPLRGDLQDSQSHKNRLFLLFPVSAECCEAEQCAQNLQVRGSSVSRQRVSEEPLLEGKSHFKGKAEDQGWRENSME